MNLTREDILNAFEILNEELIKEEVYATIILYGGAVMSVLFNNRESTKDIDAIFLPKIHMDKIIKRVGSILGYDENWFNDGVKGFVSDNNDIQLFNKLSNLDIYTATPNYMFAMKSLSSRVDNENEMKDLEILIKHLKIDNIDKAYNLIEQYYPRHRIQVKTQYVLSNIIERVWGSEISMNEELREYLEKIKKLELKYMYSLDIEDETFGVETEVHQLVNRTLKGDLTVNQLLDYTKDNYPELNNSILKILENQDDNLDIIKDKELRQEVYNRLKEDKNGER